MAADARDIAALLERWRAQGADRLDALRFQRIAALHRRASEREGAVLQVLDARLAGLIEAYAADLAHATSLDRKDSAASPVQRVLGMLADDIVSGRPLAATDHDNDAQSGASTAVYPELAALDAFRQLWSTLRTGSQVRKSLADVPTGAGPLNSTALAHRSLTLMGGLSPDYLQRFLSYVDTLSWLETLQDAGVLTGKETAPPVGAKPRAKPRARKRG